MKTTIDIPDAALEDAFRFTGAKTKRDAVVRAIEAFIRHKRMSDAADLLGQSDTFCTPEALMEARLKNRSA